MAVVDLTLNADLRKATKDVSRFSTSATKSLSGLKSSFGGLAKVAGLAVAAFGVKKLIDAAAEQETAVRSLNTALALTGDFSAEASLGFQTWASELQANSTVGDEVSLSLVGLAKQMGATNSQTKLMIETAANMSAITGDSLDTSVTNLAKTLSGVTGRLAMTETGLKTLTAEQLKAGAGIDILAVKYKGMAKAMTNTFSGAMKKTKNDFGDLLEEMGFFITKNPLVIKAIQASGLAFAKLGTYIKESHKEITDFSIDAIAGLLNGLASLVDGFGNIYAVFTNFNSVVDASIFQMANLAVAAINAADTMSISFTEFAVSGLRPFVKNLAAAAVVLNKFGIVTDGTLTLIKEFDKILSAEGNVTSRFTAMKKEAEAFRDAARDAFVESTDKLVETKSGFDDTADSIRSFADELTDLKDAGTDANKTLIKLSATNKNLKKESESFGDKKFFSGIGGGISGNQMLKGGAAVATGLSQGAKGATSLAKTGVTMGADALLPGAGAIAGPLFDLLASGPDAAKATIEAFVEQVPVLINAIVEALPVVVTTLADNMDEIILALVMGAPDIVKALVFEVPIAFAKAMPGVFFSLAESFIGFFDDAIGDVAENFVTAIGKAIADIVTGIVEFGIKAVNLLIQIPKKMGNLLFGVITKFKEKFGEFWKKFNPAKIAVIIYDAFRTVGQAIFNILKDGFDALIKPLKDLFNIGDTSSAATIGGSGRGPVEDALGIDLPGHLAKGGDIPSGFENDDFPAFLQTGENVVDRSTNNKLNNFLDNAATNTNIIIQVGEQELARVLLNLNRQGFRTA